jgi:Mn-dependent DtxR family transcriptional regulator
MSEIVFRDEEKEQWIDDQIKRGRANGETHEQIAKELGIPKYVVQKRAARMIRRGFIGYYPRRV